jgi:hypothetical protein
MSCRHQLPVPRLQQQHSRRTPFAAVVLGCYHHQRRRLGSSAQAAARLSSSSRLRYAFLPISLRAFPPDPHNCLGEKCRTGESHSSTVCATEHVWCRCCDTVAGCRHTAARPTGAGDGASSLPGRQLQSVYATYCQQQHGARAGAGAGAGGNGRRSCTYIRASALWQIRRGALLCAAVNRCALVAVCTNIFWRCSCSTVMPRGMAPSSTLWLHGPEMTMVLSQERENAALCKLALAAGRRAMPRMRRLRRRTLWRTSNPTRFSPE